MPAKRRSKARPKTSSTTEEGRKLSLKDIKEEIDDLTIFEGVLAYAKLQQKYSTKPKEVEMSFKEFEAKIEEFKKEEIYKPETTLETSKAQDVQTTPVMKLECANHNCGGTKPATPTAPPRTGCDIKPGENSENVKQLQQFLTVVKTYEGKIDGVYGSFTISAVKAYQRKHNLTADGYAGCETTTVMKLECANYNCGKAPTKPAETPAKPAEPPTPVAPPSSVPSRVLPDHTVSIGDIGFYAESPELVEPFQRTLYDKIEIDNGPPRYYATNIRNREMNFKVTLIRKHPDAHSWTLPYSDFPSLLNDVKQCEGIKEFTSVYIGAFKALITIKITDFKPGTAVATFNVQEIP